MSLDLRLAVTDLVVGTVALKIKCPDAIHKARTGGKVDKENSLAVFPDGLHCIGCGVHLDPWTKPGPPPANYVHPLSVLLGCSTEEAIKIESRYDSDALDAYRERAAANAKSEPLPTALAQVYHQTLVNGPRQQRLKWLHVRGLTDKTLGDFLIGHDGNRFTIPVFDADRLLAFRYRRDDAYLDESYPKYSGMSGRNGLYLYPADETTADGRNYLFVCEGELDALRLWQEKIPAVTVTNGAGQVKKIPALVQARWPHITKLIFATDMDEPGQVAVLGSTNERGEYVPGAARIAQDLGFECWQMRWDGAKDVTEALQLGRINPDDWGEHCTRLR